MVDNRSNPLNIKDEFYKMPTIGTRSKHEEAIILSTREMHILRSRYFHEIGHVTNALDKTLF